MAEKWCTSPHSSLKVSRSHDFLLFRLVNVHTSEVHQRSHGECGADGEGQGGLGAFAGALSGG